MASIADVIYTILYADATVKGIVSTRIFPGRAQQTATLPFIVYNTISTNPTNTKDGASTLDFITVQVSCFDDNKTDTDTLADAVRSALDRYDATVSGEVVRFVFDDRTDIYEEDAGVYHVALDFEILHWV